MKRRALVLILLLSVSGLWAQARGGLNESQYQAYITLQSRTSTFQQKQEAAALLRQDFQQTGSTNIVLAVKDLLKFRYDVANFREDNNSMFYDDRIAEELIRIIDSSRNPVAFEVLVTYVSKRNHRLSTINAAWAAIKNIDWGPGNADRTQ